MAVIYPETFQKSLPAGFDGVFNWDFLKGAFPRKIMPMDLDAIVEIRSEFLVFETKNKGKRIDSGQKKALQALRENGCFTVVALWGKDQAQFSEWAWGRFDRHPKRTLIETPFDVFCFSKRWADGVEFGLRGSGLTKFLSEEF